MRLEAAQQLRMSQEMRLSPRIIQAMEILQLPLLALQERIEAEMMANPVLEMREGEPDGPPAPPEADEPPEPERGERDMVVQEDGGHEEDFDRLDRFVDEFGSDAFEGARRAPSGDGERDRKMDAMANTPAPAQSLTDYLLEQWAFVEAPPNVKAAGELLISYISDDGYLRTPLAEIAAAGPAEAKPAEEDSPLAPADRAAAAAPAPAAPDVLPSTAADGAAGATPAAVPVVAADGAADPGAPREGAAPLALADLEAALALVQKLDPIGVGARDLKECLLLQLAAEEAAGADVRLEKELVRHCLPDIEKNRLPLVARRVERSVEQVKAAIENLSRLNPRPGLQIGSGTAPIIRPDVFVDLDEHGNVVITMPESDTSRLYISGTYRKLVRDRSADAKTRQFIRRNLRSAQWLLDAIRQRQQTVRRVVEEVFAVQRDFLTSGPEALRPLPMGEVARKIGVHVATVSRAVAGKYVQTPRGIHPLRMFFSGGKSREGGADVAWDAIKVKLKELIDAEDKADPLSDEALAAEIRKQGIDIARRTVAKYRSILKIPPRQRRRQF